MPPLLILTDRRQARAELRDVVRAALDGGARAFVVREKDLPRPQRVELAARIVEVVHAAGGVVIGADDDLGVCDGIHLSGAAAERLSSDGRRGHRDARGHRRVVVGRSCHDRAEIDAAASQGADYATLSPIFPTPSKPGYGPVLGNGGLARLAAVDLPLYALGGIDGPERAARCVEAGAAGVAVMGAVMRAAHPRRLVEQLVAAVEGVPV